jgi:hypothetical protein
MRVKVYWNSHKSLYSVAGPWGRVMGHFAYVALNDARLHVGAAGRRKVVETGRKTVHAYIAGELVQATPAPGISAPSIGTRIRYNPIYHETFVTEVNLAVRSAERVELATVDGRPRGVPPGRPSKQGPNSS